MEKCTDEWQPSSQGNASYHRAIGLIINFNLIDKLDAGSRYTAIRVLIHVHVIKTCMCGLYKLRDSLIGLHCCRSELHRLASALRELWY
jgi:hypothetical protein